MQSYHIIIIIIFFFSFFKVSQYTEITTGVG